MSDGSIPDYYTALGLDRAASPDDIKRAYRAAALQLHPDKATAATSSSHAPAGPPARPDTVENPTVGSAPDFMRVQEAWRVLGDPHQKAAYDQALALQELRRDVHVNETVLWEAMEAATVPDTGETCCTWPCRCGGRYWLLDSDWDAGEGEVAVPCSTCSLHILVHP